MGGGLQDFGVSTSPLGTNFVLELIGTCLEFGTNTKDLGTGLDIILIFHIITKIVNLYSSKS